jgi:hypothetical protein
MRTALKDAESSQVYFLARPVVRVFQRSESFSPSAVSRQMDWDRGSYRMASQVTGFDPFTFLSVGLHKGRGVPNEGARCGRTALLNNRSMGDCYTSDAAKHLARGGVSSGRLSGPLRAQIWRSTEEYQNLETFCIFQCSSHESVYISSGNITFCYWRKFFRTLCVLDLDV